MISLNTQIIKRVGIWERYEKLNVEIIENIEKLESIEDGIITIDFMPRNSRIYVYSSDTLNALDE